jgi:hypothetical protein
VLVDLSQFFSEFIERKQRLFGLGEKGVYPTYTLKNEFNAISSYLDQNE